MAGGFLKLLFMPVMLFAVCLPLISGCGSGVSPGSTGSSKPASCFDIKKFSVLHVSPLNIETEICRLELNPPPGFEFVDKTGKRLPYKFLPVQRVFLITKLPKNIDKIVVRIY